MQKLDSFSSMLVVKPLQLEPRRQPPQAQLLMHAGQPSSTWAGAPQRPDSAPKQSMQAHAHPSEKGAFLHTMIRTILRQQTPTVPCPLVHSESQYCVPEHVCAPPFTSKFPAHVHTSIRHGGCVAWCFVRRVFLLMNCFSGTKFRCTDSTSFVCMVQQEKETMTGSAITLYYFPIRGLAEQIRMALVQADIQCAPLLYAGLLWSRA